MRLTLETRDIGRVTIVRCKGRLVAGAEAEALRAHVTWLLRDRRNIVLHLGEVVFIDSSGLGAMVRTLTSTRQSRGDLKLCEVPEHVAKVLQLSHLSKLFESHDSEDNAVAAFYRLPVAGEKPARSSHCVLCVHSSADVVNYLREMLRRAGYEVHTSSNLRDAVILMRVSRFDLVVLGSALSSSPPTLKAFREACAKVAVLELDDNFSSIEAGEAASTLLEKVAACLQPTPGA